MGRFDERDKEIELNHRIKKLRITFLCVVTLTFIGFASIGNYLAFLNPYVFAGVCFFLAGWGTKMMITDYRNYRKIKYRTWKD